MTAPHQHGAPLGPKLVAALNAGYDQGRIDAADTAGDPEATVDQVATSAMGALVQALADAGCLAEPVDPPPAMTLQEAAELLCRLSRTRRLDEPEKDAEQLLTAVTGLGMVEYAWNAATAAGIAPADADRAHEARRLLLTLHGAR